MENKIDRQALTEAMLVAATEEPDVFLDKSNIDGEALQIEALQWQDTIGPIAFLSGFQIGFTVAREEYKKALVEEVPDFPPEH